LLGYSGAIELLAGDVDAAERCFRSGLETLEQLGERTNARVIGARLAQVLAQTGRADEAERLAQLTKEDAPPTDLIAQVLWRTALALARSSQGRHSDAEALAREAVSVAGESDWLNLHGDTLMCLADVLLAAGREDGAAVALQAAELYEAKGNVVSAAVAQAAATISPAPAPAERAG
jgi:tetratricopeptide (TPR) repeat protein